MFIHLAICQTNILVKMHLKPETKQTGRYVCFNCYITIVLEGLSLAAQLLIAAIL